MIKKLSIKQYILKFGTVYTLGIIILAVGFVIFELSHSTAASIIVLMVAAFFTVAEFIQDYERVPNKKERTMLIWSSFLTSWLVIAFLMLAAMLLLGGWQAVTELGSIVSQFDLTKMIGTIAMISLAYLLVLFFSYGKLAQMQYKAMRNKAAL